MQAKNNFSNSVIFNANYLVEPNNCINTHSVRLSLCAKAVAVDVSCLYS